MKKTIIAIGMLATVAVSSSFGQGTIVFGNTTGTKISTNSVVGGAATGLVSAYVSGNVNFYYALFYSTTQTTVAGNGAALVGNTGTYVFNASGWNNGSQTFFSTNNTAAGRLQTSSPNSDGSTSISGLSGGTAANFVIVGWSDNIGNSIAALQAYLASPDKNGWVGQSLVSGTLTPGTLGSTPASGLFGTSVGVIPGFTLGLVSPVPEPSTMVLAGLGGLSLLAFRRKK